ncbi:acrosomal protein SP-10 [Orycteropus afer afer]|uniref:Acrosomal protein SP-10 n=1 Tax=Orycteropus afer afer TaxID=1230840 RepID=A0A8B7AQM6_ORYAF|nr:acrosomal protein SP-10 [Orycteropus afer afer]
MKFLFLICLLGSARGASGQPDETLGSIDHQASIEKQLSGEYFSRGNPSDAEALYESTSGEHSLSEHSSSAHSSSESTSDKASGEKASGEKASGDKASGEKASGEKALGEKSSGEQPSGEKSSSDQALAEKPSVEKPSDEKPSGDKSSSEQPSSEPSSGEQFSSEKPSSEPPLGTLSSITPSSGTGLNCHTCSYMNEQGKCLRGEGVCITQNSQQCMLKKIFEGGKLQFMVQGCENMCPSMNLFSHGTRMQIICCRNQSFCNKI